MARERTIDLLNFTDETEKLRDLWSISKLESLQQGMHYQIKMSINGY